MTEHQAAALSSLIMDHIRLSRSRVATLIWLMTSILKAGTVNLNRLAPHIDSAAQTDSVHRRLERFFNEVALNEAEVARLIVRALALEGKPSLGACAEAQLFGISRWTEPTGNLARPISTFWFSASRTMTCACHCSGVSSIRLATRTLPNGSSLCKHLRTRLPTNASLL